MADVVEGVLSFSTLVFCFAVFFVTRLLRGIIESRVPSLRAQRAWTDAVLVLAPIVLGWSLAAVAVHYPFPPAFTSFSGRTFLGTVLGGFSGVAYRVFKVFVRKQFGVDASISPPAGDDTPAVVVPPPGKIPGSFGDSGGAP